VAKGSLSLSILTTGSGTAAGLVPLEALSATALQHTHKRGGWRVAAGGGQRRPTPWAALLEAAVRGLVRAAPDRHWAIPRKL
jgi:hypothetical protein